MLVARPEVAEETLLAGDLPCPLCRGVLRPFGNGRTRTVRGIGADTVTVTPRRARWCRRRGRPRRSRPSRGTGSVRRP